jgi:hypothetical protein
MFPPRFLPLPPLPSGQAGIAAATGELEGKVSKTVNTSHFRRERDRIAEKVIPARGRSFARCDTSLRAGGSPPRALLQ